MTTRILAVFAGPVQPHTRPDGARWESAIAKTPLEGPVALGPSGLDGDAVADTRVHGGPDRAVLAYAAGHYPHWRARFPEAPFAYGAFGENLTVEGLDEDNVCLGDVYAAGTVRLEVSLPRVPCMKIEWRHGVPGVFAEVQAGARIGWFHRVLSPGPLEAGAPLERLARPHPDWTIRRAYQAYLGLRPGDEAAIAEARALAAVKALAEGWRQGLAERCERYDRP